MREKVFSQLVVGVAAQSDKVLCWTDLEKMIDFMGNGNGLQKCQIFLSHFSLQ